MKNQMRFFFLSFYLTGGGGASPGPSEGGERRVEGLINLFTRYLVNSSTNNFFLVKVCKKSGISILYLIFALSSSINK